MKKIIAESCLVVFVLCHLRILNHSSRWNYSSNIAKNAEEQMFSTNGAGIPSEVLQRAGEARERALCFFIVSCGTTESWLECTQMSHYQKTDENLWLSKISS